MRFFEVTQNFFELCVTYLILISESMIWCLWNHQGNTLIPLIHSDHQKKILKEILQMIIYLMLLLSIWPGEIKYTSENILNGSHDGALGISKLL